MIRVSFKGIEEIRKKVGETTPKLKEELKKVMKAGAADVLSDAVINVSKPAPGGLFEQTIGKVILTPDGRQWYKDHVGDKEAHPIVRSGYLRNNLGSEFYEKGTLLRAEIGCYGVGYAFYLEFGFTAMSGKEYQYPFLKPAFDEHKERVDKEMEKCFLKVR